MALRLSSRTFRPTAISSTTRFSLARYYASKSDSSSGPLGEGIVGKGDKNARPAIIDHEPPANPKDPEVQKHNEEFEKRPDRAENTADDRDAHKVDKNFWKGQGGVDREA